MESFSVQPVAPTEAPIVASILTDATQHKINHGDNVWGSDGWTEKEVLDYLKESEMFVFKIGNRLAGTVSIQWSDERNWGEQSPDAVYIHRLAVTSDLHGQNIGAQIIDWVEIKAAAQRRKFLRLDCPEDNEKLCSYYEGLGFVKVGTTQIPEYGSSSTALFERAVRPVTD
jgi:ribosomal protein S18 acetylase RimI-like enzyme